MLSMFCVMLVLPTGHTSFLEPWASLGAAEVFQVIASDDRAAGSRKSLLLVISGQYQAA